MCRPAAWRWPGRIAAVYPRESPGGWRLIGRTDVVLFDAARDRPALLEPGDRVRFWPDDHRRPHGTAADGAGRRDGPGLAHLGVPPSGAADRHSYKLGNALVGNEPGAASLEATLAGPTLRLDPPALLAVTGAEADARLDGEPLPLGRSTEGALLELGRCRVGVRAYVAVAGGIEVEPVLGSRSHDLLTGLGPPPLSDGDVIAIGVAGRTGVGHLRGV